MPIRLEFTRIEQTDTGFAADATLDEHDYYLDVCQNEHGGGISIYRPEKGTLSKRKTLETVRSYHKYRFANGIKKSTQAAFNTLYKEQKAKMIQQTTNAR
jgi:hypothetical protein